jgi:hypothetical protein
VLLRLPRSARLAIPDDHLKSALTAHDRLFAAKQLMLLHRLCDIPTRHVGTAGCSVSAPARANQRMATAYVIINPTFGLLVGAARFELATPSPPDWCANRAALRSDEENPLISGLGALTAFVLKTQ